MSASTKSTSESPEKSADRQPLLVSEENLAALLRATASSAKAEVQLLAEDAQPATPVAATDEVITAAPSEISLCPPDPAKSSPLESMESRLALFATVKEHRSAILRSKVVNPVAPLLEQPPAGKVDTAKGPAEESESVFATLAPKIAPLQITLPKSKPLMPASTASIATTSRIAISHREDNKTQRTRLVIGFILMAVIIVVGVSTLLVRTPTPKAAKMAASAPANIIPLHVQIEPLGNDLIDVRWNPQSTSITQARAGRLMITEHNRQPQIIPLNPQELTAGHVSYHSSADWLQLQLEIVESSGSVSDEPIVTWSSKPPLAVASIVPPQGATPQNAVGKVESIPIPNKDSVSLRPVQAATAPPNRPPAPRTFQAPTSSGGPAQQVPVLAFDQPPIIPSNVTLPPTLLPSATLNNPPAPAVNQPAAVKQVQVGGNLQAASLIKSVAPHYPSIALSSHMQGTVRFTALIGKDGTVRNLQLISGNQVLVRSASDAVKQWIYRPTLLNGEPVEVITQIDVNFTLK